MEPLRFHQLKQIEKSPAHARYALDNPSGDSTAMRMGRLIHAIVLGTPIGPVFTGKRIGKKWTDFKAEHDGLDIITDDELSTANYVRDSIQANPEAVEVLQGRHEETILFDYAGRPCRVTPDSFSPELSLLTELKSTADANPHRFPHHALRMGYHVQVAWQKDGLIRAGFSALERLSIVAVEVKPPYSVCVFGITPAAEDLGRRMYTGWMEEFLQCESAGFWPGYGPGVLDAPSEDFTLTGLVEGELVEATE